MAQPMNTHDKYKLPPLPEWADATLQGEDRDSLFAWAEAAIEADRQSRDCGQCVPLSTDGKSVFIDGVGEVPLDFGGQARGNADASAVSSEPVA